MNDSAAVPAPIEPDMIIPDETDAKVPSPDDVAAKVTHDEYLPELPTHQSELPEASRQPHVAVIPVATNEFRITLDGRAIGHALAPHEAPIVKSWMESVVAEGSV